MVTLTDLVDKVILIFIDALSKLPLLHKHVFLLKVKGRDGDVVSI